MTRPIGRSADWTITTRAAALALLAGCALSIGGCASNTGATADAGASTPGAATRDDLPPDDLAAQIADDAAALEEWFDRGVREAQAQRDAEIFNDDTARTITRAPVEPVIDESSAPAVNAGVAIADDEPDEAEIAAAPAPAPEPEPTLDQRIERLTLELATRLRERADAGEQPLRTLASLAALELIRPGVFDNPAAASLLTTRERDALGLWRDMLRYAGRTLEEHDSATSILRALRVASEQAREFASLELPRVALCSRVDGYGQFTPLANRALLANSRHRLGLYVEVDGFGSRQTLDVEGTPAFSVELSRELSLYHDADGLLAWRRPASDITDVSRNRRRDFFLSEVIELPQTLTVGSYRLKVTVTDRVTGAIAEAILPIDVVADAALTRGPR